MLVLLNSLPHHQDLCMKCHEILISEQLSGALLYLTLADILLIFFLGFPAHLFVPTEVPVISFIINLTEQKCHAAKLGII